MKGNIKRKKNRPLPYRSKGQKIRKKEKEIRGGKKRKRVH